MKAPAVTHLLLICLALLFPVLSCTLTGAPPPQLTASPLPTAAMIPSPTPIAIGENGEFSIFTAGKGITVVIVSPDRGSVADLKVSAVNLDSEVMVVVTDPNQHYLPEIHFLSPTEHERIQIGVKVRQLGDQEWLQSSLRIVHNVNVTALVENSLGDTTLGGLYDFLAPYMAETDFGLLVGIPPGATAATALSVYETTVPGVFLARPVGDPGEIQTMLVLTFAEMPATPLTSLIESKKAEVQIEDFTGLTPEDIANLQQNALATETGNK